jgi:hypothetical protein
MDGEGFVWVEGVSGIIIGDGDWGVDGEGGVGGVGGVSGIRQAGEVGFAIIFGGIMHFRLGSSFIEIFFLGIGIGVMSVMILMEYGLMNSL